MHIALFYGWTIYRKPIRIEVGVRSTRLTSLVAFVFLASENKKRTLYGCLKDVKGCFLKWMSYLKPFVIYRDIALVNAIITA